MSQGGGQVVYDANLDVYWLADANFAASLEGRKIQNELGVTGIEPNGMMDYPTAQKWVAALNHYNQGLGWMGHNTWQLPDSPMLDATCGALGPQGASFGGLCEKSALGSLYYLGLKLMIPQNVAPDFGAAVGPFRNMQLSYYWTAARGGLNGRKVFSFGAGDGDATTINDSFYYVLPMVKGEIGAHSSCASGGIVPYTSSPAADSAVYDCEGRSTWPIDANLAATHANGVTSDVWILEKRPFPQRIGNQTRIKTAPIVGGAMLFETATQWVAALNAVDNGSGKPRGYLQSNQWQLPDATTTNDLRVLYTHLHLDPSEQGKLRAVGTVGPFQNLQPFFYWAKCVPQAMDSRRYPSAAQDCASGNAPPGRTGQQMNYDFTFGYGIQATDASFLKYFVMVYYPGAKSPVSRIR